MTFKRLIKKLWSSSLGASGLEYIVAVIAVLGATLAFISVSSKALERGVDSVAVDLSTPDSLSQTIGTVYVEKSIVELDLLSIELPHAINGIEYNFDFRNAVILAKDGVPEDLVFSLISGSLPVGLSFSNGVLSGFHTEIGSAFNVPLSVEVTDGTSIDTENYDLIVRQDGMSLLPKTLDVIITDQSYSVSFADLTIFPDGVTVNDASWSIASGRVPSGISLSQGTGVMSGIYEGLSDFNSIISVDVVASGYSASQTYQLQTQSNGLRLLPAASAFEWSQGNPASFDAVSYLEVDPSIDISNLNWIVTARSNGDVISFPSGMSQPNSHAVSGTPTVSESYNFDIDVTVSLGQTIASQTYSVLYEALAFEFSPEALPTLKANQPYEFSLSERLTIPPSFNMENVTWSKISGNFPSGISFNSQTGVISGTFGGVDDSNINLTFRATLPDQTFVEGTYVFKVIGAGAIATSTALPKIPYGAPYSFDFRDTLTTRNPFDFDTLKWTYSGSALPVGLNANPNTGLLTGTQFSLLDLSLNLLVVATDAEDVTATAIHNIEIDGLEPFSFALGTSSGCMLDEVNAAWCFGASTYGQLGSAYASSSSAVPIRINDTGSSGVGRSFTQIAMGAGTACGIRKDNTLWCWGENGAGQLGNGTFGNVNTPTQVNQSAMGSVKQVDIAEEHVCAVNTLNKVWCWGYQNNGRLGNNVSNGDVTQSQTVPMAVVTTSMSAPIEKVVVGGSHSCALDNTGDLWCWGRNSFGTLGIGSDLGSFYTPQKVVSTSTGKIKDVWAGRFITCAVNLSDEGFCWGRNSNIQVGVGVPATQDVIYPTKLPNIGPVREIAPSNNHGCAVDTSGEAWCWGTGSGYRLGVGDQNDAPTPRKLPYTFEGIPLKHIETSEQGTTTCAWGNVRKAWCWGSGNAGRRGDGTGSSSVSPTPVSVPILGQE
jgi:alpha-tubulin suppressor-like RCC1 family protein